MATLHEIRMEEFVDSFNGNPPQDMLHIIVQTGEWLETLTGEPHAANAAMLQLLDSLQVLPEQAFGHDRNWRTEWDEDAQNLGHVMKRGQDMTELLAFSGFGLRPDLRGKPDDLTNAIEETVAAFRAFTDSIPARWGEMREVHQVALASEARIRLDTGKSVSAEQLAALAGIGLRSLQNLLTKKGTGLTSGPDGRIAPAVALEWLRSRESFRESIWMDPRRETDEPDSEAHDDDALGEYLFVPVAADGTAFTPDCRRGAGYTVGLKGEELPFEDYRAALAHVAAMTRPAWRRPNPNGNWGIVRADRWERRSAASLGLEPTT
jgi:hypothetical protein